MNILRNLSEEQHSQVEDFFHEHVHENIQKEFHQVIGFYLQGTLPLIELVKKLVEILGWHPTHKLLHFIREGLKIQVDDSVQELMDSLKPSNIAAEILAKRFNADEVVEHSNKRKEKKEASEESQTAKKRTKSTHWTHEENDLLRDLVEKYPKEEYPNQWTVIAKHFPNRDQAQCYQHWHRVLRPGIKKGPWTLEEEELLTELVEMHMLQNNKVPWAKVAAEIDGRIDTSCRYMWNQLLRSQAIPWKQEEDTELLSIVSSYQHEDLQWDEIAKLFNATPKEKGQGRTALECKQRFLSLTGVKLPKSRPPTKGTSATVARRKPVAKKGTNRKAKKEQKIKEEEIMNFSESDSDDWSASSDSE